MEGWLQRKFGWIDKGLSAILLILLTVFSAFVLQLVPGEENAGESGVKNISDAFVRITDGRAESVSIPSTADAENGEIVLRMPITKELLRYGGIGFYSKDAYVHVYLDDMPLYGNYTQEAIDAGVEAGNVWNHFEIQPFYRGEKYLTVRLSSMKGAEKIRLNDFYLGNQQNLFVKVMRMDYYIYLSFLTLMMLGILVLFARYIYRRRIGLHFSVGMLGMGSVFAAICVFSYSNIVAFEFMSGYVLKVLKYASTLLGIGALAGYAVQNVMWKRRQLLLWLIGADILWVTGFLISHYYYPRGFTSVEYWSFAILLIATVLLSLVICFVDWRRGHEAIGVMFVSFSFLPILFLVDIFLHRFYGFNAPVFSIIGAVAFFFVNSIYEIHYTAKQYEWAEMMNYYKELARTDQMTALKNRVGFVEDAPKFKWELIYLTAISFDVDNLKIVNDTHGHTMGDDMITTAADLINYCFGKYGECYRMSGDEFLCISDRSPRILEEQLERFRAFVEAVNRQKSYRFRVSAGIASFEEKIDQSLDDLLKRAENRMYEDKKRGQSLRS